MWLLLGEEVVGETGPDLDSCRLGPAMVDPDDKKKTPVRGAKGLVDASWLHCVSALLNSDAQG